MGELSELIAEGIMSRRMIVAEVALLEQRIEELEEALQRYGSHLQECWKNQSLRDLGVGGPLASCSCGYSELIAPLEE